MKCFEKSFSAGQNHRYQDDEEGTRWCSLKRCVAGMGMKEVGGDEVRGQAAVRFGASF